MIINGEGRIIGSISAGEMFQNNILDYHGTKIYQQCDMFGSVKAGSYELPMKSLSTYKSGDRVLLFAGAYFAEHSYPPACIGELNIVKGIENGKLLLKYPITHHYNENVLDVIDVDGVSYGKPRILNWDRPENPYRKEAIFKDTIFSGDFAFPAEYLELTNCEVRGWWWPSESRIIRTRRNKFAFCEYDKLVESVDSENDIYENGATNGGSIERVKWNMNKSFAPVQLCPRYLDIRNTYIQTNDEWLECLSPAPAMNPIRRLTVDQLTFNSGPNSKSTSHINVAPFQSMQTRNMGKSILTNSFFLQSTMEIGTTLFAEDGSDGGEITSIVFDGKDYVIDGTWQNIPTGIWRWSPVKELVDYGGHRILDGKRLFNGNSLRWKGNRGDYVMKLDETDFGATTVVNIYGYIESIRTRGDRNIFIQTVDPYGDMPIDFIGNQWVKQLYIGGTPKRTRVEIKWRPF